MIKDNALSNFKCIKAEQELYCLSQEFRLILVEHEQLFNE